MLTFKENCIVLTFWSWNDRCHSLEEKDDGSSDLLLHSIAVAPKQDFFRTLSELRALNKQPDHLICETRRSLSRNGCAGQSEENIRVRLKK